MDSKVSSRPNHYEALRLTPDASADDIAKAYARELRSPRTIGQIALAGIAYEVLCDPVRRAAYDRSIGLGKEPEAALLQWSGAPSFRAAYMRTARAAPAENKAALAATPSAPPQDPGAVPHPPSNQRLPSHLAAAFRDLAQPEPLQKARTATPSEPESPQKVAIEPAKDSSPTRTNERGPASDEVEDFTIDWRRIGIGAGSLVVVASLVGVWAGSEVGSNSAVPPTETASKTMLPPATPFPETLAEGQAAEPAVLAAARPVAGTVAEAPTARSARNPRPAVGLDAQVSLPIEPESKQIAASDPLAPTVDQPPQELVSAAVKAASMPLPNRTIARTIERIGYSCGQVASTDAVEGQAGVFTVSCTSGHAYQARPVNGRYRFKRVSR